MITLGQVLPGFWQAPSLLAGVPSGPKAAAAAGHIEAASRAQHAPRAPSAVGDSDSESIMYSSWMQVSVHAHWHRY
jgi:hypothetical protein